MLEVWKQTATWCYYGNIHLEYIEWGEDKKQTKVEEKPPPYRRMLEGDRIKLLGRSVVPSLDLVSSWSFNK